MIFSRGDRFRRGPRILAGTLALLVVTATAAHAALALRISYTDPDRTWSRYYPALTANLKAAAQDWGQYFAQGASLEVEVVFVADADFRARGASVDSAAVIGMDGKECFEQAVATEIRTGNDPNGSAPDIRLEIGTNYLTHTLWLDPEPQLREATVPENRVDAVSVFLHELGHTLGFNGWMNPQDGTCAAGQRSTFDQWVKFDGTNFYFHGLQAMACFGQPVPIAFGNVFHLGNAAPRPGSELATDVMNGESHVCGERYYLSRLDLAVLADTGLPMKNPPPALTKMKLNDGRVQFQVSGPRARWYRVEVSTNLVHWAWVMDYVSTHPAMTVMPDDDLGRSARYYRAQIF